MIRAAAATVAFAILVNPCSAALRRPLTDAEVDKLAEQWEEGEEEDPDDPEVQMKRRMEGGMGGMGGMGGGGFDPEALKGLKPEEAQAHMGAATSKGQTKMIFLQFNPDIGTQADAEAKMGFWVGQLMNNALAIKPYPIEPTQMMVTIDDGSRSVELIQFFQAQPEIDRLDLDQKQHYGVNSWSLQNADKAEKLKMENDEKNKLRGDKYQARKKREDALKEKGKDPFKQGLKRGKAEQGAGSKKKKKKKGGKTKKKTAASGKADGEAGKKKKKSAGKAKTKKKKTAKSGKADGEL